VKSTAALCLTRSQLDLLRRAAADKHGRLTWSARSNPGGSIRRAAEKLESMGLLQGRPFTITPFGRDAIPPTCVCDGRKHWERTQSGTRFLRARHRTNPYCKAHVGGPL
jgi:hypothetical protein